MKGLFCINVNPLQKSYNFRKIQDSGFKVQSTRLQVSKLLNLVTNHFEDNYLTFASIFFISLNLHLNKILFLLVQMDQQTRPLIPRDNLTLSLKMKEVAR